MPETFDARNKWFECVSIAHIWNQGICAADWVCIFYSISVSLNVVIMWQVLQNLCTVNYGFDQAISVTSAINDRICIKSKKNITAFYSPQKVLSCCDDCGDGCNDGYSGAVWQYWMKRGLVTGGDYGSNEVIWISLNLYSILNTRNKIARRVHLFHSAIILTQYVYWDWNYVS